MSINIAIIDSGVNPWHSHVQGVEGGLAFYLNSSGQVLRNDDFRDELGHGTAIAGIIRQNVPLARLYAIKIFHEKLEAPASLLLAALEWATKDNIKIIHLSLGTERAEYRLSLRKLCQHAYDKNIVIIGAARRSNDQLFPAIFDTVIGAYWNRECDEASLIYHPGNAVEFGAYGWPRALPGRPKRLNFSGNSFAAARVTAKAAQLLEKNPNGGTLWVKEMLAKNAEKEIYAYGKEKIVEG